MSRHRPERWCAISRHICDAQDLAVTKACMRAGPGDQAAQDFKFGIDQQETLDSTWSWDTNPRDDWYINGGWSPRPADVDKLIELLPTFTDDKGTTDTSDDTVVKPLCVKYTMRDGAKQYYEEQQKYFLVQEHELDQANSDSPYWIAYMTEPGTTPVKDPWPPYLAY